MKASEHSKQHIYPGEICVCSFCVQSSRALLTNKMYHLLQLSHVLQYVNCGCSYFNIILYYIIIYYYYIILYSISFINCAAQSMLLIRIKKQKYCCKDFIFCIAKVRHPKEKKTKAQAYSKVVKQPAVQLIYIASLAEEEKLTTTSDI